MRDETAREIRYLRGQLARANRRIATSELKGKVKPGSQNMQTRTLRLILGKAADGSEILSPPVKWAQQGAGRLKIHSVPADNEQMVLKSQSGTVGEGSMADWATYDKDHGSPSDKDSEAVIEFDDGTKISIEKERARVAAKSVHVDAETVTLGGEGGKQVARVGDRVAVREGSSQGLWPIVEGSLDVSAT